MRQGVVLKKRAHGSWQLVRALGPKNVAPHLCAAYSTIYRVLYTPTLLTIYTYK